MHLPPLRRQSADLIVSHRTLDEHYRDAGLAYEPQFCSDPPEAQAASRADSFANGNYDIGALEAGTLHKLQAPFDATDYEAKRGVTMDVFFQCPGTH
jgi:hypothetical protein